MVEIITLGGQVSEVMAMRQFMRRQSHSRCVRVDRLEDRTLFNAYTVTNVNDSGTGSLRQAIKDANAHLGADIISFNIGGGGGLRTISPTSGLPSVTDPVTIDATTQPGFAGKPLIEIRGDRAGTSSVNGLRVDAGSSTIKGLIINRFSGYGIFLYGKGSNAIRGNWIGLDNTGTADAGNLQYGVFVGSATNTIGGTSSAYRNVISGNDSAGVKFYGAGATGNVVQGNYIGTNATGSAAVGNGAGVHVNEAPGNTIGGSASGARNVISGNKSDGVLVNGTGAINNTIAGNYIGTDATGANRVGNNSFGVEISQPSNTVGGTVGGSRNVISGNTGDGVALYLSTANSCKVQGNFIGTDATGTKDLGNTVDGLMLSDGAYNNTIGGTTSSARNVISGNDGRGVGVFSGAKTNTMAGNYIGTNAAGTGALGNGAAGVNLISTAGTGNVIGGTVAGAGNVISANKQGLSISSGTLVYGNCIGTTAAGTGDLGNATDGVYVGGTGSVIGSTATSTARNVISGNNNNGVWINGGSGNKIVGNRIGTDVNGGAVGNSYRGVLMMSTSNNTVQNNTIANNANEGVMISAGTGNRLQQNSISGNAMLGIGLNWGGVSMNDSGDGDTGPNNTQNFPVISSAKTAAATTAISGSLNSKASTSYRVEFFASSSLDSSGYGEGKTYLGLTTVMTDGSGNAKFTAAVSLTTAGYYVTATATSLGGDTSEFAKGYKVVSGTTSVAAAPPSRTTASVLSSSSMTSLAADVLA
jgi:parallel beta-helix repeat protein